MNHSFNVQIAEKYGIEEAIIIEHLYFWIHKSECEEVEEMIVNDRCWCRSSTKGFNRYIPYMNPKKIGRTLNGLAELGILLTGNFNRSPMNQTLWYAFSDDFKKELISLGYDFPKMENAISKKGKCNNSTINSSIILDNNIKENKKELLKNNSKKEENDSDFDEFYKAYPLKKGKEPARRAWKKLTVKEKQQAKKVLDAYISDCIENNRSYKYPATYLNQKTWEDDFAGKEESVLEIPADDVAKWGMSQVWMKNYTPRIADKVTYKDFAKMRAMVMFNSRVYAEILKAIDKSDYDGDIVKEFERMTDLEEYSKSITA